ncbi:MAG TPA: prolyl oligopeptidase family serine peptidase [Stellaceae bacterium]|jgi:polyhydroxybutyrate depolymerase|nr:prolyl oligopeptidase family serine peptidase [Stellaceae bacterium]
MKFPAGWLSLLMALSLSLAPFAAARAADVSFSQGGREVVVHLPARLPPPGSRALVIVLHGGLGNAQRIANQQSESALNMDAVADQRGFIVAYLNGTSVARMLSDRMRGWNAGGGCCGQPAKNDVDDVGYIKTTVADLAAKYGVDRDKVFGIGHSNGAMMAQRVACETTVFAAVVAVSGPLTLDTSHCPAAAGRRVLAIHGAEDQNVPIDGGRGTRGVSGVAFKSEAYANQIFTQSGGSYTLQVIPGADHAIDRINSVLLKTEGANIAEKAAQFFGIPAK